jgi:hypothetical protein
MTWTIIKNNIKMVSNTKRGKIIDKISNSLNVKNKDKKKWVSMLTISQ